MTTRLLLTLFAALTLTGGAISQERGARDDLTPQTRKAVKAGLDYLKKIQNADGSFGTNYTLAASGLAGMAFLGYGSTYSRGNYAEQVQKLVEYLLKIQDAFGYFDDGQCRMHGHGYGTLFLAQAYGTMPPGKQKKVREALQKAVRVICKSQTDLGGWGYMPRHVQGGWGFDEGSVTVTQVQALRAARDAGIHVPERVIKKGLGYIKKSTSERGCRYTLRGGGRTTTTLTAAAAAVLNAYGVYDPGKCKQLRWALTLLEKRMKASVNSGRAAMDAIEWAWYGNLYAAQACWQAGEKMWKLYYKTTYRQLLKWQDAAGGWSRGRSGWGGSYGAAFSTAIACLILELPMEYLPIFQKPEKEK